jgi:putative phage-type endonuclease
MNERSGSDWLEARYDAVTGTDVAKIMGLDPSCSRVKLFRSKVERRDLMEDAGALTRQYLELGRAFEPIALNSFKTLWPESEGFVPGMTPHRTYNWLCGTADYLTQSSVVEIKCHFHPGMSEATPIQCVDALPVRHWCQVQTYLEIFEKPYGVLYSWTMNHGSTAFQILRDQNFFFAIALPELTEFWTNLKKFKSKEGTPEYLEYLNNLKFARGQKQYNIRLIQEKIKMGVHMLKKGEKLT